MSVFGNQYFTAIKDLTLTDSDLLTLQKQQGLGRLKEVTGHWVNTTAVNFNVLNDAGEPIQLPVNAVPLSLQVYSADVVSTGGITAVGLRLASTVAALTRNISTTAVSQANMRRGYKLAITSMVEPTEPSQGADPNNVYLGVTLGTQADGAGTVHLRLVYYELDQH
jgi:hypothetical protein